MKRIANVLGDLVTGFVFGVVVGLLTGLSPGSGIGIVLAALVGLFAAIFGLAPTASIKRALGAFAAKSGSVAGDSTSPNWKLVAFCLAFLAAFVQAHKDSSNRLLPASVARSWVEAGVPHPEALRLAARQLLGEYPPPARATNDAAKNP